MIKVVFASLVVEMVPLLMAILTKYALIVTHRAPSVLIWATLAISVDASSVQLNSHSGLMVRTRVWHNAPKVSTNQFQAQLAAFAQAHVQHASALQRLAPNAVSTKACPCSSKKKATPHNVLLNAQAATLLWVEFASNAKILVQHAWKRLISAQLAVELMILNTCSTAYVTLNAPLARLKLK